MGGFDAGALFFKIQSVGKAIFVRDMADSSRAIEGVEKSSRKAAGSAEQLGTAQDGVGRKAKTAKQGLDSQAKASEDLEQKTRRAKKSQDEQAAASAAQAEAAKKLSAVLLTVGVSTAAMLGVAVAKNTEFDQAMSQVRAATMASVADQKALGEAALEAGADTAYSAREAANAQEELAKAGQSVSQIVGGSLSGSLSLAAAGQLQVARSAEIMATTLTQFKLPAEEAGRVADVLAAGAGKAQGSVDDLSLAMSYVGPIANSIGWDLEETAGTIAYFASQGILGEKAGTSLRGVLAALQAPSQVAQKVMDQYGISVYDANGRMLEAAPLAQELATRLGGLSDQERQAALGRIFGNESLLAATLLYEGGAQSISKWTGEVTDAGYAAEQAAIRQDNLAGDIEKLGGAFDTGLIRTGSGANDTLREMVQIVTGLVDWYGELPAPVHSVGLTVGIAAASMLLMSGAAVGLRAKFGELRSELAKTNTSMRATAIAGAASGAALTGVLLVIGALAAKQSEMSAGTAEFAESLDDATGSVTDYTRELIAKKLAEAGAFDAAKAAGVSQKELTDALYEGGDAFEAVNRKLRDAHDADQWNVGLGNTINTVKDLNVQLGDAKDRHDDVSAATEAAVDTSQTAASAYLAEADAAAEVESELRTLIDTLMEANGVERDAISSNIAYQDTMREVDERLAKIREGAEGFASGLDVATDAGARNMESLVKMAQEAEAAAAAQHELDGDTAQYRETLEGSRQALIDRAEAFGATAAEARALADDILAIPTESDWKMIADTAAASSAIGQFIRDQSQKIITIGVRTYTKDGSGGLTVRDNSTGIIAKADGGQVKFYADGGENHQAQYARPGDWRVWAEPETGGEWYLPDSPAKRARSLSLAADMLDGWGYQLTPKGANYFAKGGKNKVSDTVRGMQRDWERSQRRGENRAAGMGGNGFSLIDELLDVADQSTKRAAERLRKEAVRSEKQFRRLEKAAESADKRLDSARDRLDRVRDAAASMASSVSSAVRRLFDPAALGSATTKTSTTTRKVDGQNVTTLGGTTTAKPTPKTLIASMKVTAHAIKNFALKLTKLEQKGYPPALLAEVASLGVEEGTPVADALLKATSSQVKVISGYYSSINKYSKQAGETVADANYEKLIKAAEKQVTDAKKNADDIRRQLSKETDRIIRVISSGLSNAKGHATGGRITGPGSGTSDSVPIWASNDEHMITAAEVRGAGGHAAVEQVRDMWRRGQSVADMPLAMVTSGAGHAPQITIAPTFVNPIAKDVEKDAWKAGLLLSGMVMGGNL